MSPALRDRRSGFVALLGAAFGLGMASFAWALVQLLALVADQQAGVF